jgi:hypothetical protein
MRCFSLNEGVISPGIQLWQDDPTKCFVHLRPNVWMPVHADLLNCDDPTQVERRDGQIILHRASAHAIANHVMEFIPEVAESAGHACVLANIDNSVVQYTQQAPQPDFEFETAMGLNFYAWPIGTSRVTQGADSTKLACEEYSLVVGMKPGDSVNLRVIFKRAGQHGSVDPWVEGAFLRFDGSEPTYHRLVACTQAERFRRAA